MAAYPFAPMPTLAEFIEAVEKHGCIHKPSDIHLRGTGGERQFATITNSTGACVVLPNNLGDNDHLTVHVVRSLCARLEIDPSQFGLHLDSLL